MAKPNYHHAKKQKELARKSRQQEKQQRRSARTRGADAAPQADPPEEAPVRADTPVTGGG
jgi:hypothetical protein